MKTIHTNQNGKIQGKPMITQQEMLTNYLVTLTEQQKSAIPNRHNVPAEYFCADEYNANECARLIDIGKKTASCGLKEAWHFDNEPYPQVGQLTIVTGNNSPFVSFSLRR